MLHLIRWDMGAIGELPQYLQVFYKELLDTYSEFEEILAGQGRSYSFIYAKEAVSANGMQHQDSYNLTFSYLWMLNFVTYIYVLI